jgi:hypothetical protein
VCGKHGVLVVAVSGFSDFRIQLDQNCYYYYFGAYIYIYMGLRMEFNLPLQIPYRLCYGYGSDSTSAHNNPPLDWI